MLTEISEKDQLIYRLINEEIAQKEPKLNFIINDFYSLKDKVNKKKEEKVFVATDDYFFESISIPILLFSMLERAIKIADVNISENKAQYNTQFCTCR